MKATVLHEDGQKTWALIFEKDDEVIAALTSFAEREGVTAAHFTAIGAFSAVTLGYFDRARKTYRKIPVKEQVEVLSLVGDVALEDRSPKIHAHVVVGKIDGTAHGGHLLDARVWPTLELILTESPRPLARRSDPASGLALIDVGSGSPRT
jgi:predicted DNA-binding protein with PD1-like motif